MYSYIGKFHHNTAILDTYDEMRSGHESIKLNTSKKVSTVCIY